MSSVCHTHSYGLILESLVKHGLRLWEELRESRHLLMEKSQTPHRGLVQELCYCESTHNWCQKWDLYHSFQRQKLYLKTDELQM